MFRYRLPYTKGSKIIRKSISGTVLYTYKWFYTKEDLNLLGCIKEEASSLQDFKLRDKLENIKRLKELKDRIKHNTLQILKEAKKLEPKDYTSMKKQERYEALLGKSFSRKELKGKTSKQLLELLELEENLT